MKTLEIKNLHVNVEDKEILKGVDLMVRENEIHALMGPNGNGKSTLLAAIMGNPKFEVTEGEIWYDGIKAIEKTISDLQMKEDLAHRFLNEGFSGGEKKRNEIVQMELLKPSLAMLDEIDSGLDVDAIKIVGDAINRMHEETGMSVIIVSHYERFLEMIRPQFTHVLVDGRIVCSGGPELANRIDSEGYDWIYKEYNITPAAEADELNRRPASIGVCAVRESVKGLE